MKCVACGEPRTDFMMCQRCVEWFTEWARHHDTLPTDDGLPEFMDYSKHPKERTANAT